MTSDAKIGLLLGLVFIFVIAFIINGLPNFGDHAKAGATPVMNVQNENFGVADNTLNAQERLDWQDLLKEEGEDLVAVPDTTPEPEAGTVQTETPGVADDTGDLRRVYTLKDLAGSMSGKIQQVVKDLIDTVPPEATTTEPAPAIETPRPEPSQTRSVETVVDRLTTPKPAVTPPPARTTAPPKIYVVEEGDVLATVAKKAYGPEEGNRLVNIDRIFKANQDTLETPDKIVVGQKLVIPPLPAPKPEAGKSDAKLSGALFEKVEQIGKGKVAEQQA
jgi:LysM repeat protein